jgi:hypothetical protein
MAAKKNMTVSVAPTNQRPSSAQRRAAQISAVSTKQAELKREAAERRAKRALNSDAPAASMPRKSVTARRRAAY